MHNVFGLPILFAILCGILFPYTAIQLTPYALIFLFLLMLMAGLVVDWRSPPALASRAKELAIGLTLTFFVIPLLLWLLARSLIDDSQYLYGFVFSTLCPIALVAPYFSRVHGADKELALAFVIASMAVCPLVAPLALGGLFSASVSLNLVPLTRYMLLLITLPLILSIVIARLLPRVRAGLLRFDGFLNSTLLALLVFTLFGTAVGRINTSYLDYGEVGFLLLLVLIQDFGVLLAARFLLPQYLPTASATALAISLSMKNVAIAAGVLLIYDPRASLAPALAFIAHAALFNVVGLRRLTRWLQGPTPNSVRSGVD